MSDGTYRDRWIDTVFATVLVSPEVKVLLLSMGRRMDEFGRIKVKREELATAVTCHPRKVTEKQRTAIAAGLLIRTAQGRRGGPAEFQASVPGDSGTEVRVPTVGTLTPAEQGADCRHPNQTDQVNRVPTTSTLTPAEQGADSRHPNPEKGCRLSAPKPAPEPSPPYKDRARALTTADRSHPTADVSGDADEAVVIDLFDKTTPSLRSEKTPARLRAEPEPTDAFDAFWRTYPRRVGKGAARKAWATAIKNGADPETVTFAAHRYATDPRRCEADPKYTPHPATWLNQERWDDEPDPEYAPPPVIDRRQQATDDQYARQLERARALDALEAHGEP